MNWNWRVSTLAVLLALAPVAVAAAEATPAIAALPPAFEDIDDVPMPDPDLWHRIRKGFAMDALDSPLVADHEAWYTSRPEYIKRFVDRGSLYLHYIVEQVEKRNMPMEIALLPVIESAFNPKAYSRAKASGIWQFIPSTGKNYGLAQDWWKDNRRDIVAATDAALNYLERLHAMFGDWELALAAYNAGEGTVGRAIAYNQKKGLATDYLGIAPRLKPETRNYVPKLIAVKNIVLSPAAYGIDLESVPDEPYFTEVQGPKRIDVKVAAKLAGMSEDAFVALNPAHNNAVAAGTGTLIVPVDKADDFKANLERYDQPLVSWTTYQAKRGEALDAIAKRHNTTVAHLKAANGEIKLDKKARLKIAGAVMVPIKRDPHAPIKVAQVSAVNAGATRVAAPLREAVPTLRVYTVRAGDTLYAIAQRYRTTVDTLLGINSLGAKAVLQPGLKLRLP
ncbi:MAG: transglycosylase SLT domain-containing protein [Burkholderiales bacterium]|nr:transglycosylase SLT domain-containing protein [Burkholderiales bacterium]